MLAPIILSFLPANAKMTRVIKAKVRAPEQKHKTSIDKKMEELIAKHLGEHFRRAGIFDIYPEIEGDQYNPKLKELSNYFNYTRADLKRVSQGEVLKGFRLDFDKDSWNDYAVIVHNKKTSENLLFIGNQKNLLYLDIFKATHLELVNYGKFPTTIPAKPKKRTLNSPAIKLISFDEDNKVLHFNTAKRSWEQLALLF